MKCLCLLSGENKTGITDRTEQISLYSRISMARTSLGPWALVLDMGSSESSHRGLIIAPGQEINEADVFSSF